MSLKRVLGMMLASRMGGRGRRRGALGTAGVLGGLGRSGMGRKMGMAALGYMAYQAYRDHQARAGTGTTGTGTPGTGTTGAARPGGTTATGGTTGSVGQGGLGGIGDMIRDVADRITGGAVSGGAMSGGGMGGSPSGAVQGDPGEAAFGEDERRAADSFSENKALLLLRAMIAACYSDGALSNEERQRIMGEIEAAGGDADDRRTMEREIANPRPVDELLGQVHDHETAEEFYLASRAAIDGGTEANKAYLARLRERLRITEAEAAEVETIAS